MNRRILCDSLIEWMKTLNPNQTINRNEDLSDGIIIASCLNNIDSTHFNNDWLQNICTDVEDNNRIKVKNLNEILKHMTYYYSKIFDQALVDFQMPDLNMIAESANEIELSRLLQLVLGCAVTCNRKESFIERIMSMEKSVQLILMNAIQELMINENKKNQEEYNEITNKLKTTIEELNRVVRTKEDIENRCHQLTLQISTFDNEKWNLIHETSQLKERIQEFENLAETEFVAKCHYKILQEKIHSQQTEILKLETALHDYKSKCDYLHSDNENLLKKNDDLMKLADNARTYKDELDVVRDQYEKMSKLESTIDMYKIKLEEMSDLRKQIKHLEEKNLRLLNEKSQLEQESQHTKLLQTQVEFHKKTHQELYHKISELQSLADKTEFEKNRLEEKLNLLNQERQNLIDEIELLRKMNVEFQDIETDDAPIQNDSNDQLTGSLEDLNILHLPNEVRQHFICLQHENEILQLRQNAHSSNEKLLILQESYDQINDRNVQLTQELKASNQKILELELALQHQKSFSENTTVMTNLKKSFNRAVSIHEEESVKTSMKINELEKRLENAEKQLIEKDDIILKKTSEITEIERHYREYLEKAKMILLQMDPNNQNSIMNQQMESLRRKLHEKDRKLKELQKEYNKLKTMKEDQDKLFISAWHSLASRLQPNEFNEQLKSHKK